jgi:folate-dependent phosphoribosylglycinamide formyltransferase PurN
MKIAVITGQSVAEKLLCARLSERHDIAAIIHPGAGTDNKRAAIRRMRTRLKLYGMTYFSLWATGKIPLRLFGWDRGRAMHLAERELAGDAVNRFEQIKKGRVHHVDDINGDEGLSLIGRIQPDVVLCHGGPIYKKRLIECCNLILNFHSGLSPLYNGTSTIAFAFANGHPRLCGGTMMVMDSAVDGGDILAHCLPSIEPGDDPARLFLKVVSLGADLYANFLAHLSEDRSFSRISQEKPLFYMRSSDWTVYHRSRIAWLLEKDICAAEERSEQLLEYWRAENNDLATAELKSSLLKVLGNSE